MSYQWLTLWSYGETFLAAAWLTLQVTLLAFVLAVALGLLAALAKASAVAPLRWLSHCYVEFIRNTPVLLQIFIIFFGLPSLGITMSAFTAGVLALGINVGAYLSETFRAGIQSVPKGQLEAAWILGISRRQVFLSVVLPQAARAVWPAIINNLIQLLLGTSLLSAIALPELTGTATVINARTLLYIQTFSVVALVYLLLSNLFSWLGNMVGSRLFHPQLVTPVKKSARCYERYGNDLVAVAAGGAVDHPAAFGRGHHWQHAAWPARRRVAYQPCPGRQPHCRALHRVISRHAGVDHPDVYLLWRGLFWL